MEKTNMFQPSTRNFNEHRILHTMLRVRDLDKSLHFYTQLLGMRLLRQDDYPEGRFTLAFIGYQDINSASVIELTYNWDVEEYQIGTAYGHIAISVSDIYTIANDLAKKGVKFLKEPGPMRHSPKGGGDPELIAFIEDPDGYHIELIEC